MHERQDPAVGKQAEVLQGIDALWRLKRLRRVAPSVGDSIDRALSEADQDRPVAPPRTRRAAEGRLHGREPRDRNHAASDHRDFQQLLAAEIADPIP